MSSVAHQDQPSLTSSFQEAAKRVSIQDMVNEFQRIYALPSEADGITADMHDSLHAFTGFGITGADELRVDVYATALTASSVLTREDVIDRAMQSIKGLHAQLKKQAQQPDDNVFDVGHTQLDSSKFLATQTDIEPLTRREVSMHVDHALELSRAIKKVSGRGMADLTSEDLATIDFSRVDFSVGAAQIKQDLQSERNAAIEVAAIGVLHEAADKKGRGQDIAAPNTPWHGAARRAFKL